MTGFNKSLAEPIELGEAFSSVAIPSRLVRATLSRRLESRVLDCLGERQMETHRSVSILVSEQRHERVVDPSVALPDSHAT